MARNGLNTAQIGVVFCLVFGYNRSYIEERTLNFEEIVGA